MKKSIVLSLVVLFLFISCVNEEDGEYTDDEQIDNTIFIDNTKTQDDETNTVEQSPTHDEMHTPDADIIADEEEVIEQVPDIDTPTVDESDPVHDNDPVNDEELILDHEEVNDQDISTPVITEGIKKVSTKGHHTCGLDVDNNLYCWGNNYYGQIGIGTPINEDGHDQYTPIQIDGIWNNVFSGDDHTCALDQDDKLYCWGRNYWGQLGTGDDNHDGGKSIPTKIGDDAWKIVAPATEHTCGIKKDNTLWCFGNNFTGQCGLGFTSDVRTTPQQVGTDSDWENVVTGFNMSCGLKANGDAYCFGMVPSPYGGFGDQKTSPSILQEGAQWKRLALGLQYGCGIKTDGSLNCWGKNDSGQLGNGSRVDDGIIKQIGTDTDWKEITTGENHTCAIKENGNLYCWGDNRFAQLGNGENGFEYMKTTPTLIDDGGDWVQIKAGSFHTCGLKTDGIIYCWGDNDFAGQLGLGQSVSGQKAVPTAVF